jgi:hypothetical protein
MIAGIASPAQDHMVGADELDMFGGKQNLTADRAITKAHEACMVFKASTRHHRHLAPWCLDRCAA